MTLSIIAILLGGMFFSFGVAILFFRRYDLISGYRPHMGKAYARRAGAIQMIGGGLCVAGGVVGILVNTTLTYIGLGIGLASLLLLGYLNDRGVR